MQKWLQIVWFRFRYMLKSPANLVLLVLLPMVFSLIFGNLNMSGGENQLPKVALVSGQSSLELEIEELFARNETFDWIRTNEEEATKWVADREALAAIVFPDDITVRIEQKQPIFKVTVNQKTEQYIPLSSYMESVANQLVQLSSIVEPMADNDALTQVLKRANEKPIMLIEKQSFAQYEGQLQIEQTSQSNADEQSTVDSTTMMPIGFSLMFLLFALSGSAAIIHTERKEYTWQRLTTTSATKGQIVGGYITSFWLMGWLQFAVMMVFMYIVFHTHWGNLAITIPFISLIILCVVAYSMMMATLVHSKKQGDALNPLIIVSTCMIGGVYWPLDIVPTFMQKLALFIPQYWMMEGMQRMMLGRNDWSSLWQPVVILVALSVTMLGIAIWRLSKEQKV